MAKLKPKWREEWDRLVGDHKYLAIRNWDEYQVLTPSGVPAQWIKAYTNEPFDELLSMFEAGVLYRLRLFRGRLGHNLNTDLTTILCGCNTKGTDRARVPNTLITLLQRGRLVPTNEQDMVSKKSIVKKRIEEKSNYIEEQVDKIKEEILEPIPDQKEPASPITSDDSSTLCELVSSYSGVAVKEDWLKYAQKILEGISLSKLKPLLEWMYVEDDFWGNCTHNTKNLYDHLMAGNLPKKYNAVRKLKKKKTEKTKAEALGSSSANKPTYHSDAADFLREAKI